MEKTKVSFLVQRHPGLFPGNGLSQAMLFPGNIAAWGESKRSNLPNNVVVWPFNDPGLMKFFCPDKPEGRNVLKAYLHSRRLQARVKCGGAMGRVTADVAFFKKDRKSVLYTLHAIFLENGSLESLAEETTGDFNRSIDCIFCGGGADGNSLYLHHKDVTPKLDNSRGCHVCKECCSVIRSMMPTRLTPFDSLPIKHVIQEGATPVWVGS